MTWNKGKGPGLLWLKDHIDYADDDCLIWPFSPNMMGYGQVSLNGKILRAHRVMCEWVHGPPQRLAITRPTNAVAAVKVVSIQNTSSGRRHERTG